MGVYEKMTELADVIREKSGKTEKLSIDGMIEAASGIGSSEEFVGIKLSNFTGQYGEPKVADLRSIANPQYYRGSNGGVFMYCFYNYSQANCNGYYVELEEVYVPNWIDTIPMSMFYNCGKLKTIHGDLSNVTMTDNDAFYGCKGLVEIPYMPNITKINSYTFRNCTGLTSVNFYKTLTSCANNAFTGCTNLLDIYVPWAEGEVANAPWGATNATIHYNTTYDENHNPIV